MAKKKSARREYDNVDKALANLNSAYGGDFMIGRYGEMPIPDIERIPTGSLELDRDLCGGIPKGRIIEIYGPESSGKTTLTLSIAANAQKEGGNVAFVDSEHALDPEYAKKLGVDMNAIIFAQPDTGEQSFEIVAALANTGKVDLIIVDSVAALIPKDELDGLMGESLPGLHARLMSQGLKKVVGASKKNNCTIIFINQIRQKIGVMYGCFHYDTLVNFSDGRSIPIGEVVENKITGNVFSYNEKLKKIEEKPITAWHYNGKVRDNTDFIHLKTSSINGKGRFGLTLTPNHKVLLGDKWVEAKDVNIGDIMVSKFEETVNGTYGDFLNGCMIGDLSISIRGANTANIRIQDNANQRYMDWKSEKLSKILALKKEELTNGDNWYRYKSKYSFEFSKIKKELNKNNRRDPLYMLDGNYSDMSLAIWYMDDGHYDCIDYHSRCSISIKRMIKNKKDMERVKELIQENTKISSGLTIDFKFGKINFDSGATIALHELIKQYVPDCMQYKLREESRGFYKDFELYNNPVIKTHGVKVTEKRFASDRQMRNKKKFDISVKDNKCYMVGGYANGVVVHNSNETTTGGNSLKFYASLRLKIHALQNGKIKQGEDVVAERRGVRVVKSKVSRPHANPSMTIRYGVGIDKVQDVIDYALKLEYIESKGAWYYLSDKKFNGKTNLYSFFSENKELCDYLYNRIKDGEFPDEESKKEILSMIDIGKKE
jgi:recombination protein RecA